VKNVHWNCSDDRKDREGMTPRWYTDLLAWSSTNSNLQYINVYKSRIHIKIHTRMYKLSHVLSHPVGNMSIDNADSSEVCLSISLT
jgi:hypothetical protein